MKTDLTQLQQFILKASRATYASGDEALKKKQEDGSTAIFYRDGEYAYHDNYFGGEPYGGREVVFYRGEAVWMMVYYGFVMPEAEAKEVYPFLMKSLSQSTLEMPYRGPEQYQEGEFQYENKLTGDVQRFAGTEKIYKSETCIYEANYSGGLVDQ